jgi:hypothetical protein
MRVPVRAALRNGLLRCLGCGGLLRGNERKLEERMAPLKVFWQPG